MSRSPYFGLPPRQFWKTGVGQNTARSVSDVYTKRFALDDLSIATAGSCFAQHIASHLRQAGYTVLDKEPAPRFCNPAIARRFGYGLYSARHGNIYTARHLLQLAREALGLWEPDADSIVWSSNGRYFDALRPSVEPDGLSSIDEVLAHRHFHLSRFRKVLREADLFVFTFGLTEAWTHGPSGIVYPTAPGTIAGQYVPSIHKFKNFSFQEVYEDFVSFRSLAHTVNPTMKFLITVSPVPLTATAEDSHVLVSTVRSKSTLRSVAAQLYSDFDDVDYFPSYELLSTPFLGDSMFEDNRRTVRTDGVRIVMNHFFKQHPPKTRGRASLIEDLQCEDIMLEAFSDLSRKAEA